MSMVTRFSAVFFCTTWLLAPLSNLLAAESAQPTSSLSVSPQKVVVSHPRFPQSLIVGTKRSDGVDINLTRKAKFVSANPKVARVDERGLVWPLTTGQTTIEITANGMKATVSVTSQPVGSAAPVSYLDEVQPILSKARCNQGACHGYSLGKNGFHLSLRGADAKYDHMAITKEYFGRRIHLENPALSMLLTKPAGVVPHEGGKRFRKDSDEYRRLAQWIREGASSDSGQIPKLVGIEVTPKFAVLAKPGDEQQLQVTAKFDDGTTRDVTPLTIFSSGNEGYASVDKNGLVTMLARAEAPIQVRYERVFDVSIVVALGDTSGVAWSNPPERNVVDKHVFAKLREMRINPSELADDATFLRRASLDLIGVQPSPEELRAFIADKAVDKRDTMIETLFQRPEFVDFWSMKWGDLLQNSRKYMSEESMYAFRDWIRHAVSSNMPLDRFAREVLTGKGAVRDSATAGFYRISTDPKISLERTAQIFTGIRMLCARCHPHPFENWTQADYYGLASFFNQVGEKTDYLDPKGKIIVVNRSAGYERNPRTNQLQPPRFLGGAEPKIESGVDRRTVLANWLTTRENPLFARSLVNRFWSYFFSRGIIDPVDDIRVTNPPINPRLLAGLTKDFVDHNFDLRHLMRTIVQSRTYQLSSVPNKTNAHDVDNFSHAMPRRLTAEQLLDSIGVATGIRENIAGAPGGFRAAQVPDTNVKNEFLDLFGRSQRMEACECERSDDTNMLQALHMINGNTLLQKMAAGNGRIAIMAKNQKLTPKQRIEEIYVMCLCRVPTDAERKASLAHVKKYEKPLEAYQDLVWALLNSSDFVFVH